MTSALSGSKSELVVDGESDDAEVESRNVWNNNYWYKYDEAAADMISKTGWCISTRAITDMKEAMASMQIITLYTVCGEKDQNICCNII